MLKFAFNQSGRFVIRKYIDSDIGGAEVQYTTKDGAVYVIVTQQPKKGKLSLPYEAAGGRVMLLETGEQLREIRSAEWNPVAGTPIGIHGNALPVIKSHVS